MDTTWNEINKKTDEYVGKNDLMSAIDCANKSVKEAEKVFGKNHFNSGISHFVLGTLYARTKQTKAAQEHLLKAWNIHKKMSSQETLAMAAGDLQYLLNLYAAINQQKKVEDLLLDAIGVWEKSIPQRSENYYLVLIALSNEYSRKGAFDKAEKLLISKLNTIGGLYGRENSLYGRILGNLGSLYFMCRLPTQAIARLEEAISLLQILGLEFSPEYATFESTVYALYLVEGKPDRAGEIYQSLLNRVGDSLDIKKAGVLDKMSQLLWDIGDYGKAQPLLEKLVEFYRAEIQKDHPDDIPVNAFAALDLEAFGKNKLTSAHRPYIEAMKRLANLHIILGEYQSAAYLYTKIWKMSRTIHGLKDLNSVFYMMGKEGEALFGKRPYNPAWENDPDLLNYLESLETAARLFFTIGDYSSFMEVAAPAFTQPERLLGKQHPITLQGLIVYAQMETLIGNPKAAFECYQECAQTSLKVFGYKSPIFREAFSGLAALYEANGLADHALEMYRSLLANLDENNPLDVLITFDLNISIAKIYAISGDKTKAIRCLIKSVSLFDKLLSHIMAYGYNQRLEEYVASYRSLYHILLSLFVGNQNELSEFIEPVYGVLLKRKAVILEWAVQKRIHIQRGEDPTQAELFSRLKKLQEDFASQLIRSRFFPLLADVRKYQANEEYTLNHCAKEIRELEKALVARLPHYATSSGIRQISLEEIISKLPDGCVLIDYAHYESFESATRDAKQDKLTNYAANFMDYFIFGADKKNAAAHFADNLDHYREILSGNEMLEGVLESLASRFGSDAAESLPPTREPVNSRYAAFVVKKDQPRLQIVDIGEASHVDNLIASLRQEITDWGMAWQKKNGAESKALGAFFTEAAHALSKALLNPVLPAISGYKKVLISADGALFELPFEILPLPGDHYLIEEYDIHYIDAVRNIIHFDEPSTMQSPSLIVADPDYDLGASVSLQEICIPVSQEQPDQKARVATRICSYFDKEWPGFSRLKGAKKEGLYVCNLLGQGTILWLDKLALKGKLLKVKSPQILHIATHGFVFSKINPRGDSSGGPWFGQFDDPGQHYSEINDNPLLRCGLLLAGANSYLRGGIPANDAEDGFLTGVDICNMDLSGTDLVVLSACCTGLGEIQLGEGVFGLRRAFVLAGARSILVSLWSVPDYETKELLSKFYNGLSRGLPKPTALKEAKLAMINDLRQQGVIDHPFTWGAFICTGDPRSIERSTP